MQCLEGRNNKQAERIKKGPDYDVLKEIETIIYSTHQVK